MNDLQAQGHMASYIERRKFLATLLGGAAAAWPLSARAQQAVVPVVGFLSSLSQNDLGLVIPGFLQGLNGSRFTGAKQTTLESKPNAPGGDPLRPVPGMPPAIRDPGKGPKPEIAHN
jgi:hypothetical protein